MPQELCDPFVSCDGLDGRLVISTAIQGPPLAWDLGEVSFGSFTTSGAAARPYIDIRLNQAWTALEACYGPVRSIFSLAPGETVHTVMSVRHQVDFVSLVSSAGRSPSEALSEVSRGAQKVIISDPGGGDSDSNQAPVQSAHQLGVERKTRTLGGYGSFWETVADILLPGVRETVDAGEGVAKLIVNATTGDTSGVADAVAGEKQTVETISRAESQHGRNESTTSATHTETFESITRTFANPYRDRSLQLRFIPVFRHFEVRTWPESVTPGISLHAGPANEMTAGPTPRTHELLAAAVARLDMASLQRPLARMLSPTPMAASIRAKSEGTPSASAQGALVWSRSSVREDSVFVPLAEAETAASALGLEGRPRTSFLKSLAGIRPAVVAKLVPEIVQHVHLFMGTHVEAVAGECVLQDVPPPSERIN